MAKIKHYNFLDTIGSVIAEALEFRALQKPVLKKGWRRMAIPINKRKWLPYNLKDILGQKNELVFKLASIDANRRYGIQSILALPCFFHSKRAGLLYKPDDNFALEQLEMMRKNG